MLNDLYHMIDPVAFSIGPIDVRWYGIAYVLGFLATALIIWRTARRWKVYIDIDALLTVIIGAILGIILGARLGYVLFYGAGYFWEHPASILAFNEGGMSFHGGLIGGLLSGIVTARIVKMPYLSLVDLAVIGAPLGLLFGRCANFINGELWGSVTDAPWGVVFGGLAGSLPRHPSQLYEALLEGLLLFLILYVLSRKNPPLPRGTYLGIFLLVYGCVRFAIEFVREPDAQLGYLWGGWLTMGQVLSVPLIIAGVCLLIYAVTKKLPQQGMTPPAPAQDQK